MDRDIMAKVELKLVYREPAKSPNEVIQRDLAQHELDVIAYNEEKELEGKYKKLLNDLQSP